MGRIEVILLDTHVLLWMDADSQALGKTARRLIEKSWQTEEVAISAISFWECAMLHSRARINLPLPVMQWRNDLLSAGLIELPMDGETAILATALTMSHKDPADRFIAATAITHNATLITADQQLLKWKHALKRQDASR
jgi:PIN domain nuclease of toxin-antitoxin system